MVATTVCCVVLSVFVASGGFQKASSWLAATLYSATHVISCTPDQPLVVRTENFFSEADFKNISSCLVNHPLITNNTLNEQGFGNTRGFLVKMNEDGLTDFRSDERLTCLTRFFDSARLTEANAWVMNLLICDSTEYSRRNVAVGLHLDDTIGINSIWKHLAHQVNVLYASVPDDMVGGELEVWSYNHTQEALQWDDLSEVNGTVPPDELITPVENTMVAFRGDSWHQVRGYKAPHRGLRISLVMEQYIKSPAHYRFTHRFFVQMKSKMEML
uniref:Prolyl 4-hydroxylase alpha subunit Fe(2+) 2OG dioxygenase domain-containing protein n=1 Tax=Tetraselmis chuii TaxID=63592 RepID=A0A7S1XAZ5_9CHLO